MTKQIYTKWVRHYPDGRLGSTTYVDVPIGDKFSPEPLAVYQQGKDTFPEHGYLMCWKGVREDDLPRAGLNQDVCLWEVEVDVVEETPPKRLAHPYHLKTGRITPEEFWGNVDAYQDNFQGQAPPAQTIFCSRVRLIKNLTEEFEARTNV